eukprot:CAMPEP_0118670900 /NCGR_PEP_ID=MMETSP0785-20121206/21714_1 /TAXON_ID=91992 /ORGANISM="Bolidomonas pacifica, Strain CCMP 1866" /LENGTH=295 /DNA_ID=CAMNT_0006565747 /DNA_START=573 /DNA_END=1459 /DNA_ORIENTATION=-
MGWGLMSYASSAYVDVVEDGGSRSIGEGCEVMVLGAVGLEWYWRRKEGISEGNGNEVVRDTECLVDFSTSDVEYVGEGDNDNYNDNDNDNDNGNGNDNDKTTPLIKHPTTPTSNYYPTTTLPTRFYFLMLNLLVTGYHVAYVESYLYAYLTVKYGSQTSFLGLCILTMTISEIPIFVKSHQIISYLGGTGNCYLLSHTIYIIRVYLYTLIPLSRPNLFLLLEPSHALVFSLMMCSAVEDGRDIVEREGGMEEGKKEHFNAKVQAYVRNIYYCLGLGLGSLVGGLIVGRWGYEVLF